MNENELSEKIIGLAIKVHSALGPGLPESAYEKALVFELSRNGYKAEVQKSISINYEGIIKQLLTYIRLSNKKLGLLINFNEILLKNGIRRVINGTI
ncbi:MAG: GxxExxY protein [Candidatus Jettenia sp. AMX1]|nr:GxxExxY protein [Candidatus Jettenia sp. AMX1]